MLITFWGALGDEKIIEEIVDAGESGKTPVPNAWKGGGES